MDVSDVEPLSAVAWPDAARHRHHGTIDHFELVT